MDRKQHPSVLDVQSFRGEELVVAEVRERLAVSKRTPQKFNSEGFNLKKLREVEGKEQYRVQISNIFAVWETRTLR
jgi:hypothetical protein